MHFVIAYKNGKWLMMLGKQVFPRDYSNVGLGLDLDARLIQYTAGQFYLRLRPHKTRCLDVMSVLFGPSEMAWRIEGEPVEWCHDGKTYHLQRVGQYTIRPRRFPRTKRVNESWWAILDVDGQPIVHPVFTYQRAEGAAMAVDGYIRMTKMVIVDPTAPPFVGRMTYLV